MNRVLPEKSHFKALYEVFSSPISELDCGQKCGPYNAYGVPVCCDIKQMVPAAYQEEWAYLKESCDLWRPWHGDEQDAPDDMMNGLQGGQVLLQCLGYLECQRPFRSITCRAFPFFPYLDSSGDFLGLAYYWDFREDCWIISNLAQVQAVFKREFREAYARLFDLYPDTRSSYLDFSAYMREAFYAAGEELVILGFSGELLLVDPVTERYAEGHYDDLEAYGPYQVTRELMFPDEIDDQTSG